MPQRKKDAMEIREVVRRLRAGESDRAIARTLAINRKMVARYRIWAEGQGLLEGELPPLPALQPQAWLLLRPWNNFFLIAVMVWLQTGFAMIVISSALKNVPQELLEAGRIDGANEYQLFARVTVPYIWGTIITVSTTIVLFSLRVFDIVRSMTGGNFGTQVIANEQYTQMFRAFHYGRGAAIAVVLLVLVIPVMYYNLRSFLGQTEAFR